MKIAVIGKGAREHCIAYHIKSQNPNFKIYAFPGNPGMESISQCISIAENNIKDIIRYVQEYKINYVFVGSEVPLSLGIADALNSINVPCFGVKKEASQLESSKIFAKKILEKYNIPHAQYQIISSFDQAINIIQYNNQYPKVIKADGLASGKGVFIVNDNLEAKKVFHELFIEKKLGKSAEKIIFEDYLEGKEISVFAFIDKNFCLPFSYVQDYKKLYEGEKGPNTGGMGSYNPVAWLSNKMKQKLDIELFSPLMKAFAEMNLDYRGILYAGLKIKDNNFYVLEFNVRFGDPEAQVILPLLKNSLIDITNAINNNKLSTINLSWYPEHALSIVFSLKGYPNKVIKGNFPIQYPDSLLHEKNMFLFFSGIEKKENIFYANGGRIFNLVALDKNLEKTRDKAYQWASKIHFPNLYYRLDIGNVN